MKIITSFLLIISIMITIALTSCKHDESLMSLNNWVIEDASGNATITVKKGEFDIIAPDGLTLWYNKKLTGNYKISYDAMMPLNGSPYERISDLNCFWGAQDPLFPDNFFERSTWRNGIFKNYNSLNLFYVGYGGNQNTTTRFRKYHGKYFEKDTTKLKPVLFEYLTVDELIKPNKWYHIEITVTMNCTRFIMNGELLFSHQITPTEGDGYFGLRLFSNHTIFANFKIEQSN